MNEPTGNTATKAMIDPDDPSIPSNTPPNKYVAVATVYPSPGMAFQPHSFHLKDFATDGGWMLLFGSDDSSRIYGPGFAGWIHIEKRLLAASTETIQ